MIHLFLKYNPIKYVLAVLILLAIRIVAFKMGLPITEPELIWMMVGERMSEGFTLYKEVWSDLEPFAAGTYYILNLIVGKSTLAYFILGIVLTLFQAVIFTIGLNQNKVFKEQTSLPALFYVLFSSLFFDFYTLSPVSIGLTFILMSFNMICFQSRVTAGEDRFFYIGILTGIASLFYLPLGMFLFFALASLGFYSVTNLKKQIILALAFCFPYILVLIYYFWIDNLGNYFRYAVIPVFNSLPELLIDLPTLVKITVLPLLLLLAATGAVVSRGRYIHYQYKIIKIVGLWIVAGVLAIVLIEKSIAPHLLIIFVPALSFFATHLFMLMSYRKILAELFFLAMFGGILLISFYALYKPDAYTKAHLIKSVPKEFAERNITDRRVLVLGNEHEYYINNRLSGQYVKWSLSEWQFEDLKKYENISAIYETFEINKPEYVVDNQHKMDSLSILIPVLQKQYERIDSTAIYKRRI